MFCIKPYYLRRSFYFKVLVILSLFVGCEKEQQEETTNDNYLVSFELKSSFTSEQVKAQLGLGSLLYPEVSSLISTVNYGVKIYKITYHTTFLGDPVIASGLVSIPDSQGAFPVISFQNGTNTCNSNAPTVNSSNPVYAIIGYLASNGYVFCIPDYIGFGESSDILHPYMHRQSSDIAVVDLLRALEELVEKEDISPVLNSTLYLMGYSQGGWATLSLLEELERNPVGNLSVSAVACGAGSYDLLEMTNYIFEKETYPNPFYMPYFIESRRQNNILDEPLSTFFNEPYADIIPSLFDGNQCNTELNSQLNDTISVLLKTELIEDLESNQDLVSLKSELENNSVSAWQTGASIRFFHSKGDKSVPFGQTESIYGDFVSLGVGAELVYVDSLDHNDAIISWGVDAITWINSKN